MALTTISDYKDCIDLVDVKYYEKTLGLEGGVPISLDRPECPVLQSQLTTSTAFPLLSKNPSELGSEC